MAEVAKLLYIVVVDDAEKRAGKEKKSFRYTRPVLQTTLQLMGCKPRHAFKISRRVFEVLRSESFVDAWRPTGMEASGVGDAEGCCEEENNCCTGVSVSEGEVGDLFASQKDDECYAKPFELYKRLTTVVVGRETFFDFVCCVLTEYKYIGPNQRADLALACRIREREESVTVLLCGTSGCGKSTLSTLLAGRLGITTVISTDSIRHMMRSFVDEKQNPLLWASTYHAGEYLDPMAVAEAKAKRKEKKLAHICHSVTKHEVHDEIAGGKLCTHLPLNTTELINVREMAIEGFKAQSEMVIDSLDQLITAWEERKESVIVEGVHLSLNFIMGLMRKHPSIIPFMIYISNEDKHLERFAVRAKYMALDPGKNKYVKYIRNIRTIQAYLCNRADKYLVPKINNTNVDRSVAAIHATVFSCLRRCEAGENFYDSTTNTVTLIDEEYRNQCAANSLSSKGMFQLIQRKGSSRHMMALINTDGSVSKAWSVNMAWGNRSPTLCQGSKEGVENLMYGPLQITKAEPVNLPFGHFGISAWPSDVGGSSHTLSVNKSRTDEAESRSGHCSSTCRSPRMSDGPAKQLKEEVWVSGSDEEVNNSPYMNSDGDLSDVGDRQIHEEIEGSVNEESTKSDEEYDDLAVQHVQENGYKKNGYLSGDDESSDELMSACERWQQPTGEMLSRKKVC